MERRLVVVRHGHAWRDDPAGDHARQLDPVGIDECRVVGRALAARGWLPDRVVTSDATRTRETWQWVAEQLPVKPPAVPLRELYGAGWRVASAMLARLDDDVRTAMLIGHNPGCEEIVEVACHVEGWAMPTANAVLLVGEGATWAAALRPGAWTVGGRVAP